MDWFDKIMLKIWKKIEVSDQITLKAIREIEKEPELEIASDISYANDNLTEHLFEVIYPPEKKDKYPTIVNIHGGGFAYGSKELYSHYCKRMALEGYAVVSFNYGLAPYYRYPSFIVDTLNLLRYIGENAEKYHIDKNNIYLDGDSAGAYITAVIGNIYSNKDYAEKMKPVVQDTSFNVTIKGIMLACGLYDFDTCIKTKFDGIRFIRRCVFGKKFRKYPYMSLANVTPYITSDYPPTLVVSSLFDPLSPESLKLIGVFNERGVQYESIIYPVENKLGHVYHLNPRNPEAKEVMQRMKKFFNNSCR